MRLTWALLGGLLLTSSCSNEVTGTIEVTHQDRTWSVHARLQGTAERVQIEVTHQDRTWSVPPDACTSADITLKNCL